MASNLGFSNPALNDKTLRQIAAEDAGLATMTLNGAINKTGILILLVIASSAISWSFADDPMMAMVSMGSVFVTLILSFVIIFKRHLSPTLAPIYAICEGLTLGFISQMTNRAYPGIVFNSIVGSFSILFAMLAIYRFRIIQATETFRKFLLSSMIAILVVGFVNVMFSLFGHPISMLNNGPLAIGISVFSVGIASLCFINNFDMIEKATQARAPKYMEWYAGFSVLLTLIWLYLEILRLFGRLQKR